MRNTVEFKNLKCFIDWIITKNNVKEIIDEFESQSEKGFVFELFSLEKTRLREASYACYLFDFFLFSSFHNG